MAISQDYVFIGGTKGFSIYNLYNLASRFQEASCVHLTDEETETLKGQVTCPGSHSKSLVNSFDKLVSVFTGTIVQQ